MGVERGGGLDEGLGVDVKIDLCGKDVDMAHGVGENREKSVDVFSFLSPESQTLGGIVVPQVMEPGAGRSAKAAKAAEDGECVRRLMIG